MRARVDGIYEGMPEEKQCWWMIRNEKFIHMVQEPDPMERIAFKDKRPEKAQRSADTFQSLSAAAAGTAGVHVWLEYRMTGGAV